MIKSAGHMYIGEEVQVAETLTKWIDDIFKRSKEVVIINNKCATKGLAKCGLDIKG